LGVNKAIFVNAAVEEAMMKTGRFNIRTNSIEPDEVNLSSLNKARLT